MTTFNITFSSRSHRGKVRKKNQDALAVQEQCLFGAIADGIGGERHGEVASQLAVDACINYLSALDHNSALTPKIMTKEISNAIKFANEAIITVQKNDHRYENMGTTLNCFWLKQLAGHQREDQQDIAQLFYSWVGDSRIYRIRPADNQIKQLTKDHTLNPKKIDAHQAPKLHRSASNILTQKVGSILLLKPDTDSCTLRAGDIFLACTDGLTNRIEDSLLLEHAIGHRLEDYADYLLDEALDRGGQDNISFILGQLTDNESLLL